MSRWGSRRLAWSSNLESLGFGFSAEFGAGPAVGEQPHAGELRRTQQIAGVLCAGPRVITQRVASLPAAPPSP